MPASICPLVLLQRACTSASWTGPAHKCWQALAVLLCRTLTLTLFSDAKWQEMDLAAARAGLDVDDPPPHVDGVIETVVGGPFGWIL